MKSDSRRSRQLLKVGTVFYHREFEGHSETKDRYFVVAAVDDASFHCFTTTTSEFVIKNPHLKTEVTALIPKGSACLPKECVIDCRELHSFDDILMTNRLSANRVTIEGSLPVEYLRELATTIRGTRTLDVDVELKEAMCAALDKLFDSGKE